MKKKPPRMARKEVLSIFMLPAKGKSRGVILDEFLNAHDMITFAAPLTFV